MNSQALKDQTQLLSLMSGNDIQRHIRIAFNQIQNSEDLKRPIIKRGAQRLTQLSYKERNHLMNIFLTYDLDHIPDGESEPQQDSTFLLTASIPYPKQLQKEDILKAEKLAKHAEAFIEPLDKALKDRDINALMYTFGRACHRFTKDTVHVSHLRRLNPLFFSQEFDPNNKKTLVAQFSVGTGKSLGVAFNIADSAFEHSKYHQSGLEMVGAIIHEIAHLEQQVRFFERSISSLIEQKIIARPSAQFNIFGNKHYAQAENHFLSYRVNPKERQARFRQYAVLDLLNGKCVKSERQYLRTYLNPHVPDRLKKKMKQIYRHI